MCRVYSVLSCPANPHPIVYNDIEAACVEYLTFEYICISVTHSTIRLLVALNLF